MWKTDRDVFGTGTYNFPEVTTCRFLSNFHGILYGRKCFQGIFWSLYLSRYSVVQCVGDNFWTLRKWNWYGSMHRDRLLKVYPDTYSIYLVQEACNALGVTEWVTRTLVAMLRVASDLGCHRHYCRLRECSLRGTRCYRTLPCGCGIVASRSFSVSLKVLSQGNLRRRSLQGPRSATTGWLTNTTP